MPSDLQFITLHQKVCIYHFYTDKGQRVFDPCAAVALLRYWNKINSFYKTAKLTPRHNRYQ
jgi:hypothetical protein